MRNCQIQKVGQNWTRLSNSNIDCTLVMRTVLHWLPRLFLCGFHCSTVVFGKPKWLEIVLACASVRYNDTNLSNAASMPSDWTCQMPMVPRAWERERERDLLQSSPSWENGEEKEERDRKCDLLPPPLQDFLCVCLSCHFFSFFSLITTCSIFFFVFFFFHYLQDDTTSARGGRKEKSWFA